MTAKNDITGDSIKTKNTSQSYLDNYDKIFGVKGRKKTPKHGATQIHENKKKSDNKIYYDLRSEAGSGYVLVPIDKARNKGSEGYAIIDSNLTKIWNESVAAGESKETNLFANDDLQNRNHRSQKVFFFFFFWFSK